MKPAASDFIASRHFIAFRLHDKIQEDLQYILDNYPQYGPEKFKTIGEVFHSALSLGIHMLMDEIDSHKAIEEVVKDRSKKRAP